ncbi:hypothetical protein [Eoetvoesiella caeni]|uniref:Uncharacterized protein n=1 Tax=Eoetvoesiella caeni TaxID=645616 RepID=A0A366HEU4_9BURK|nr:hypothetical protein [Eoetvoesiella caeni]MCI2808469.1 hypothetical protein [Eoetvoesiella caeni]NYT55010.1 hypothetical protein [Eoetvoesiella caeni]RBP41016.1 hypothetical protein DFR37_103361 [Eoetvoesiella caeni]
MADNKPKFSPGLITAVVTIVFLVIFGFVIHHGQNGISHSQQVVNQAK